MNEFLYNVKVLATGYDLCELENMLENKDVRQNWKLKEIESAIKNYYSNEYIQIRKDILKDRKVKTYKVTLILDDFGDEVSSFSKQSIVEYMKNLHDQRIKIKKITNISDF